MLINLIGKRLQDNDIQYRQVARDLGMVFQSLYPTLTKDDLSKTSLNRIHLIAKYLGVKAKDLYCEVKIKTDITLIMNDGIEYNGIEKDIKYDLILTDDVLQTKKQVEDTLSKILLKVYNTCKQVHYKFTLMVLEDNEWIDIRDAICLPDIDIDSWVDRNKLEDYIYELEV